MSHCYMYFSYTYNFWGLNMIEGLTRKEHFGCIIEDWRILSDMRKCNFAHEGYDRNRYKNQLPNVLKHEPIDGDFACEVYRNDDCYGCPLNEGGGNWEAFTAPCEIEGTLYHTWRFAEDGRDVKKAAKEIVNLFQKIYQEEK